MESPRQFANAIPDQVGAEPDEDAKRDPKLEAGHDSAANRSRRNFGRVDGNSRDLNAHANTHEQPAEQQTPPVLCKTLGKHRKDGEETSQEDGPATTQQVIDGVGCPGGKKTEECWSGIDGTNEHMIVLNAELDGEREVCAIGTSVVPTLNRRPQRAEGNGEVHLAW